jgi:hypothetical protein
MDGWDGLGREGKGWEGMGKMRARDVKELGAVSGQRD